MESTERHDRLTNARYGTGHTTLTYSSTDYRNVEILPHSVIYCDIPYIGANAYTGLGRQFGHEQFYDWCLTQTTPVFISSYDMPHDLFIPIAAFKRTDTLSATNNNLHVTEKIFIPSNQSYTPPYPTLF